MKNFKKIFSHKDIYEIGACDNVVDDSIEREPVTINGFNTKLGIYVNNLHQLQEKYIDELKGRNAIKKKVQFVDFAGQIYVKKKINFRFEKPHLKMIGKSIVYCNPDISKFELKNVLFKIFQRNVDVQDNSKGYYLRLGIELDELVEYCFKGSINKKQIGLQSKVLFNPSKDFNGKQRRSISAKIARS